MSRPARIPDELRGRAFTLAQAEAAGVSRRALQGTGWRRLLRGVYAERDLPDTAELRIEAVRLALPSGGIVAGRTAAWLYGAWKPRPGQDLPLDVIQPKPAAVRRLASRPLGRRVLDPSDVVDLAGLPVTAPERTCFDLMVRADLTEAVVVADCFLHQDLVTQRGLARYADERPHWPGVRLVRTAVLLSNPLAESPMETRLRMVIVLAGLPEPAVNVPLHDADGRFLGRPDLFYFEPGFGIEYDGSYHGEYDVHRADLRRENRLLLSGMPLLRYTGYEVYRMPEVIVAEVARMLGPRAWAA